MPRVSKIVILHLQNYPVVNGSGLQLLQTEFTELTIQNLNNLAWKIRQTQVFTEITLDNCHTIMMTPGRMI